MMSLQLLSGIGKSLTTVSEFLIYSTLEKVEDDKRDAALGLIACLRHKLVTTDLASIERIAEYLSPASTDLDEEVNRLGTLRTRFQSSLAQPEVAAILEQDLSEDLDVSSLEVGLATLVVAEVLLRHMQEMDGPSFEKESAEEEVSRLLVHHPLSELLEIAGNKYILSTKRRKMQELVAYNRRQAEVRQEELREAPRTLLATGRPAANYKKSIGLLLTHLGGDVPSDAVISGAIQEILTVGQGNAEITSRSYTAEQRELVITWAASYLRTATQGPPACPDILIRITQKIMEGLLLSEEENQWFSNMWTKLNYHSSGRPRRNNSEVEVIPEEPARRRARHEEPPHQPPPPQNMQHPPPQLQGEHYPPPQQQQQQFHQDRRGRGRGFRGRFRR